MLFKVLELCVSHQLVPLALVKSLFPLPWSVERVDLHHPNRIPLSNRRLVKTPLGGPSLQGFAVDGHSIFVDDLSVVFARAG